VRVVLPGTNEQLPQVGKASENQPMTIGVNRSLTADTCRLGRFENLWEKEGEEAAQVTVSIRKGGEEPRWTDASLRLREEGKGVAARVDSNSPWRSHQSAAQYVLEDPPKVSRGTRCDEDPRGSGKK
jgi:hypothetical protein